MHQSLSSAEGLIQKQVRYSKPSVSVSRPGRNLRYSRHLSFQAERIFSHHRSRLVIHASIRPPKKIRSATENQSIDSDHDLHSVRYSI
jgi:hypothetical protein